MVFRGRGGGGGARGRREGQVGQMEDGGTRHLGCCVVDVNELSANPEGLSAAGELPALCLSAASFFLVVP